MRLLYRVVKTPVWEHIEKDKFEYPKFEEKKTVLPSEFEAGIESEVEPDEQEDEELAVINESLIQAERILEAARQEAENIKDEAYQKGLEEGRQTGYEEGLKRGTQEGLEVYGKKTQELEQEIKISIDKVQKEKERALETYMDDLKDIAMAVGEKIVKTSLRSDSRVVEKMIIAATDKLRKSAWAKIYVGTMQQESGTNIKADAEFLKELEHLSDNVKIIVMEGAESGTCIVERPDEIIDVSVGTQLENIREIMNNARL